MALSEGQTVNPTRIKVRYSEVDRMGLLYHVNYLEYFEVARSDWVRQFYKPYRELEDAGYLLVVTEVSIKYVKPAYYDDELSLVVKPSDWGNSRVTFEYEVFRLNDEIPLCTGSTRHCFVDRSGKPIRMPGELHRLLKRLK